MKKREATPAEQAANWWQSDEGVEGLEQALNNESLASEKSVVEAFLLPKSTKAPASWQQSLSSAADLLLRILLLLGIAFIGWGLWRLPGSLPPPATPPQSSLTPSQQPSQIPRELNDLATRMAIVEANQPPTGVVATLQAQMAELQRALIVTPTIFSPTQTVTSTPSVSFTQTLTPTATTSLNITSTVTPTTTQMWTPSPSMTLQGIEGKYLGTVTPRTGPGTGSDGQGIYEASSAKLQPQIPVTVLGQWTQGNNWLLAATSDRKFFWIFDSSDYNTVNYEGEAPAIALPWWKPTPAPAPWQETQIDDLSVYTIAITSTEPVSLSVPARWEFTVAQEGPYAIEAWMPSGSNVRLTYQIETPQGEGRDREVDQSALQGKPGFYEIGTYALSQGILRISVVKVQAAGYRATAAVGPIRLVRK